MERAQLRGAAEQQESRSTHRRSEVAELVLFQVLPGMIIFVLPLKSSQPTGLFARPVG